MSEYPTFNLLLGIIGTFTGAIALVISGINYWREKPHLKINVTKCEHDYSPSRPNTKNLSFWVFFQLRNLGDRGTNIYDIGLSFLKNGKTSEIKKYLFRGFDKGIWLNAHDALDFEADFMINMEEGLELDRIDCFFTVYHTHRTNTIRYTSMRK